MKIKKQAQRLHHVSSHLTNGLFPTASLCITLFLLTGNILFENAALCCCAVGTLGAPIVYGSGFIDWHVRFNARRGRIFNRKRAVGAVLVLASLLAIVFRLYIGSDAATVGAVKYIYAGVVYLLTGVVGYLGYLGGKFIV